MAKSAAETGHGGDRGSAEDRQSSGPDSEPAIINVAMRATLYAQVVVRDFMGGHYLPNPHDENSVAQDACTEALEEYGPALFEEAFGLPSIKSGRATEARFQFRKIIRRVSDRARFTHRPNTTNDQGQQQRRVVPYDVNLSQEVSEQLSQGDPHRTLEMAIDISEALGRFPAVEAEITLDNILYGKSISTIARQRGMTDKTVRGVIIRSKVKLAGILKDYSIARTNHQG